MLTLYNFKACQFRKNSVISFAKTMIRSLSSDFIPFLCIFFRAIFTNGEIYGFISEALWFFQEFFLNFLVF